MLLFDDGRLKSAAYDTGEGFGLRVVAGESAGYAHASGLDEGALRRAAEAAALAKRGHSGVMAAGPRGTNLRLYGEEDVVNAPGFGAKAELLQEIDAYARAPRSAGGAGVVLGGGRAAAGGDPARRRRARARRAPACAAERQRHGGARRPARERLVRRGGAARPSISGSSPAPGAPRWTRRCARRWSTWTPWPAPRARWTWCWGPAGTACCCTRRWATGWKATSTARACRPFPGASASGWPRRG